MPAVGMVSYFLNHGGENCSPAQPNEFSVSFGDGRNPLSQGEVWIAIERITVSLLPP
jgi:hypothetical protein